MLSMSSRLGPVITGVLSALMVGCGGGAPHTNGTVTRVAAGSCASLGASAQFANAAVVLIGTMLPGPTVSFEGHPALASPAEVTVARYLKGSGPRTIKVQTSVKAVGSATEVVEDGIAPSPGQRWKLFLTGPRSPYETSICAGSKPTR